MKYFSNIGVYFLMLGQVFKKPQKLSVFRESLFKEVEELGLKSLGIVAFHLILRRWRGRNSDSTQRRQSLDPQISHRFCDQKVDHPGIRTYFHVYYPGRESGLLHHIQHWNHASNRAN